MWLNRVAADLTVLPEFLEHFQQQLDQARADLKIQGNLERQLQLLPGITELRYGQLQVIESVLNLLNIQLRQIRRRHFQNYLERYNRALTSRDAERYAEGEQEVIDQEQLINTVALLRNQWLGVIKGLEAKQWQLGHISRLRVAGLEDVQL